MKASSAISNSIGNKISSSPHREFLHDHIRFLYHLFGAGQHRLFDIPMAAHLFYSNFIKQNKLVGDLAYRFWIQDHNLMIDSIDPCYLIN